jgi:hypothetical protein
MEGLLCGPHANASCEKLKRGRIHGGPKLCISAPFTLALDTFFLVNPDFHGFAENVTVLVSVVCA